MPTRPCLTVLTLGFALVAPSFVAGARAEEVGGFVFEWRAPEGCPQRSAVEAEIEHLLDGPVRDHARDGLRVQATVEHGALWFVTLDTTSKAASGHRTIEAATCQGLANAIALIVALMIDPDAVAARTAKAKASEALPLPPPPLPALSPMEPALNPPTARLTRAVLGLAAAGNLGVLPSPDLGVSASVGLVHPRWRVEARIAYSPRRVKSENLADAPHSYGRFTLLAGTLGGCLTFTRPVIEIGPCFDVEIGAVRGEGVGVSRITSRTSPWLGLGAGGFLAVKAASWLYLLVHADAVVPLWRPRYVFENVPTPIFRSWPVGARLTAGVELRF